MRLFYFLLKIVLQYTLRLFYQRITFVNSPKRFFGRTIYVSNHASSFMDPLVFSVLQRPIIFFMTRSDVFSKFTQPLFWLVHMLPIYREHDGEDTKRKNEAVFQKCSRILKYGRSLLIFGEGFTDDVFVRRLKPLKKGAARIGFGALESINWNKEVRIAAVGINYADPNQFGSELLISNSASFSLNEYKELYFENPALAINQVTKRVEGLLQEQLTHVENKDWVFFHEHVTRLTRNGMHISDTDFSIPVKERWQNSRNLALWMNEQNLDENQDLIQLKADLESYFKLQKRLKIEEKYLYQLQSKGKLSDTPELLKLILFSPFTLIGLVHFYVPYILVKRFAEKSFKRRVFWSSVKMMLGMFAIGIWNIPLVWLLNHFLIHSWLVSLVVYLLLPLLGLITYEWFSSLKKYKTIGKLKKADLSEFLKKRKELLVRIGELIKV